MKQLNSLIHLFKSENIKHFFGVPDSTLSELLNQLTTDDYFNINESSNECEALAASLGSYMATGHVPVVYLQNSGLGKIVNPHTSLAGLHMYDTPYIILLGMRGDTELTTDAPQHKHMGLITHDLLKLLKIESISSEDPKLLEKLRLSIKNLNPCAIIFPQSKVKILEEDKKQKKTSRIDYLELTLKSLSNHFFISTTGHTTRDLHCLSQKLDRDENYNFYNVGSMGCASAICLGIRQSRSDIPLVLLDGDGAFLMQMGTNVHNAQLKQNDQFVHILFNNASYESTGGQSTAKTNVNYSHIAKAMGYHNCHRVNSLKEFTEVLLKNKASSTFIEVLLEKNSNKANKRPLLDFTKDLTFPLKEFFHAKKD